MADAVVLFCPDSSIEDFSLNNLGQYRCSNPTPPRAPQQITPAELCSIQGSDCGSASDQIPPDGSGLIGTVEIRPIIQDGEEFLVLSGWITLIFAISFGVRATRKLLSSRL